MRRGAELAELACRWHAVRCVHESVHESVHEYVRVVGLRAGSFAVAVGLPGLSGPGGTCGTPRVSRLVSVGGRELFAVDDLWVIGFERPDL